MQKSLQIFELLPMTSPTNCWPTPRNDPPDEHGNSQLLLFLSPKHFSSLFSSLRRAHRPTGSALFVVWATASPLAEIMTFSSIISLPPCATPLLLLLCFPSIFPRPFPPPTILTSNTLSFFLEFWFAKPPPLFASPLLLNSL